MTSLTDPRALERDADPIGELERIMGRRQSESADPFANLFDEARTASHERRHDDDDMLFEPDEQVREARFAPPTDDPRYAEPPPADYDDADFDFGRDYPEPPETDDPVASLPPLTRTAPKPARGLGTTAIAAVLAVAVIGGGGAYALWSGVFGDASETRSAATAPPVVAADPLPPKVVATEPAIPQQTAQTAAPLAQDRPAAEAVIVPREEQPVDLAAVQPPPGRETAEAPPPAAVPASGTEPRRVKTVKVLADGTIVTGDGPIATAPSQAAEVPVVEAPAQPVRVIDTSANAPATGTAEPSVRIAETTPVRVPAEAPPTTGATGAEPARAETTRTNDAPKIDEQVAAPAPRPATEERQVAAVEPEATQPRAAEPRRGGFVVQIASLRSQDEARAAMRQLQRRYSGVIGDNDLSIRRADLGDRGIVFRVRVGPFQSRDAATAMCGRIKGSGGDCVVGRN